ncbi:MAG: MFS transporter [Pseudomonadota bacterium]
MSHTSSAARPDDDVQLGNLVAACAAITVFGLAFGISYPLLSLVLEQRGHSADLIGLNAAMVPLGILAFSPCIPLLVKRFGARRCLIVAALVSALCFPLYRITDSLAIWFVLRGVQGMASATLYVLSEVWIVRFSGARRRGRVVAIYASLLSASFAAGPLMVGLLGVDGWAPFIAGTAVLLVGTVPLWRVRETGSEAAPEPESRIGVLQFAPLAPVLLGTVAVFAIMDASLMALLPVYGLAKGLDLPAATALLSVFVAGNAVLQYPIGMIADRVDARRVMCACALVCGLGFVALPAVVGTVWQWPVVVLGGATGFGIYTVALKALGDRFDGEQLIAGTSAFGVVWGGGALVGAMVGGWSMASFGANGLPALLAFSFLALATALAWRINTQVGD